LKHKNESNDSVFRSHLITLITAEQAHINLEGALDGLKIENRNRQPSKNVHSVWEEVEHIRISQEDILNYVVDPKWVSPNWPHEYWPEKSSQVPDNIWMASIDKIFSDQEKFIQIIKDESIDLTEIIPHTKSHTYLREILLNADHNSYHLGQIIIVRKLLGDWKY
jgi:DinB superfamily